MAKSNPSQATIEFTGQVEDGNWPPHEKYPLNLTSFNRKVESEVLKDIAESDQYLIVTGFTSLSHLVDIFGYRNFSELKKVKVVLGFEPNINARKLYKSDIKLSKEIKEYWFCGLCVKQLCTHAALRIHSRQLPLTSNKDKSLGGPVTSLQSTEVFH